jgi:hypothetical protein
MSALPIPSGDTAELLLPHPTPAAASPLRAGSPWPYRIAVPFIMLLSFGLWALAWQAASFAVAALVN